jgi:hypothetical protein
VAICPEFSESPFVKVQSSMVEKSGTFETKHNLLQLSQLVTRLEIVARYIELSNTGGH